MILITGATGLIGSHLLYSLLVDGEKVRAMYRNEEKKEHIKQIFSYYTDANTSEKYYNNIDWVKGDILDIPFLERVIIGIDKVYHTAAIVSFEKSKEKDMIKTNIEGTANIVNICATNNSTRLCHVSSIATLGKSINNSYITETSYWNADYKNSGYAISKNGSEIEVWRGIEEGLNAVIVNPSIIIGPGFWKTGSGKLFSTVKNGIRFYTNGGTGFVGIDDVVKTMIYLMNSEIKKEKYIISSENLKYRDVFNLIADNLKVKRPKTKAGKLLLSIAWRVDYIKNLVFNSDIRITRDSAKSAIHTSKFSNDKIEKEMNFKHQPIKYVIEKTSAFYNAST